MNDMNEKEYTGGIEVQSPALKKLDNFWYHYKWHTIFIAFFVIVFAVCTLQMCTQKKSDVLVLYAGPESLDQTERDNITNLLGHFASEDGLTVGVTAYNVLSDDEVKALEAETDEDGKPLFVNRSFYTEEYKTYGNYRMTGESSIMLLSPWLYEELAGGDRLRKISSVTDAVSEDALVGEYGVLLGKTDLYEKYEVLRNLPEDTVICFAQPNWGMGKNSKEKHYAKEEALLRAILEYENTDSAGE